MENESEVDSRAAAREARRKRILENGNNRLGKITGRVHNEETPIIETVQTNGIYDDPEFERDVFEGTTMSPNQDVFELLKSIQENKTEGQQQQENPVPESATQKFIKSKYPIIIIALLVYTLFCFNVESIIGSSVFSLLIVWEIMEFVLTTFIIPDPVPPNANMILTVLSLFLGLNTHSLRILSKLLGMFNKILRDIATFLFTFVFVHLFYNYLVVGENMSEILDKDFNKLLGRDEL